MRAPLGRMPDNAARTSIIGVVNTGDFGRRDADRVVTIYHRLSSGALMPTKVAFYFDRELRSQQERTELGRRCDGHVHFTRARMFENYLLVPEAVLAVLEKALVDAGLTVTALQLATVSAKISGDWMDVDGAKLLQSLFSETSENRVPYEKVTHGAALLDEVLRREPARLEPLAKDIEAALR